jgi:hypothetical protein
MRGRRWHDRLRKQSTLLECSTGSTDTMAHIVGSMIREFRDFPVMALFLGYIGSCIDIHEHREIESELRRRCTVSKAS